MSVQLAFKEYGDGPPLLILHGLFGSSTNWRSIAKRLSADFRVFTVDLRNHGRSGWHEDMSYDVMANDVHNFMLENDIDRATVLGHSMGGKTAMILAFKHSELIDKLIIVDIAPVAYEHSHSAINKSMLELDLNILANRKEADTALARSIKDRPTRQFLLQNLVAVNSHFSWRINLASIQQNMDGLTGFPININDSRCDHKTLFVHGGNSDYLKLIHHSQIDRLFPNNEIVTIENASHWIHVEKPDALLDQITSFINKQ
ncbi:alpha/beta fold hydrolase [Pseudomonadota bacterium]